MFNTILYVQRLKDFGMDIKSPLIASMVVNKVPYDFSSVLVHHYQSENLERITLHHYNRLLSAKILNASSVTTQFATYFSVSSIT